MKSDYKYRIFVSEAPEGSSQYVQVRYRGTIEELLLNYILVQRAHRAHGFRRELEACCNCPALHCKDHCWGWDSTRTRHILDETKELGVQPYTRDEWTDAIENLNHDKGELQ